MLRGQCEGLRSTTQKALAEGIHMTRNNKHKNTSNWAIFSISNGFELLSLTSGYLAPTAGNIFKRGKNIEQKNRWTKTEKIHWKIKSDLEGKIFSNTVSLKRPGLLLPGVSEWCLLSKGRPVLPGSRAIYQGPNSDRCLLGIRTPINVLACGKEGYMTKMITSHELVL